MDQFELSKHLKECQCEHFALLVNHIQHLIKKVENIVSLLWMQHSIMNISVNTQRIPGPHALLENRLHHLMQNVTTMSNSVHEIEEMLKDAGTFSVNA